MSKRSPALRRIWFGAVALVCVAAWAWHLPRALDRWECCGGDSAHYINAARSVWAGRGLMTRGMWGLEEELWRPQPVFPPGYPLLIAAVMSLGLSAPAAGIAVSAVSAAGSLILLTWISVRLVGPLAGGGVTLATAVMAPFLQNSLLCYSDSAAMLATAASLACLLAWCRRRSLVTLFWAGTLAGIAYWFRYATLALIFASGMFLMMHALWLGWRKGGRAIAAWAAGAIVVATPLLIRNVVVFGKIIPYHMPPSSRSLWENLTDSVRVWVMDLTTSYSLAKLATRPQVVAIILVAAAAAGLLVAWRLLRRGVIRGLFHHRAAVLPAIYLLVSTAILLAAYTRYHMGMPISSRRYFAVYWIAWLGLAGGGVTLARRLGAARRSAQIAALVVLLAAAGVQVRYLGNVLSAPGTSGVNELVGPKAIEYLRKNVGADQIVIADRADLLQVYAEIHAREIHAGFPTPSPEALDAAGRRGLLWGIVVRKTPGPDSMPLPALPPGRFERIDVSPSVDIFRYENRGR